MKRTLNIILAAAMSMALFSGCNDKNVSKYIPDGSTADSTTNSAVDTNSSTGGTPQKRPKRLIQSLPITSTTFGAMITTSIS